MSRDVIMDSDNRSHYEYLEKTKDQVDQFIDIILNYRQSGHPGGSRSKVQALLSLLLSGAMRWDIRDPSKVFADRFILGAGHTIPLVYSTLAVLNEIMRTAYKITGDKKYESTLDREYILYPEDLLGFRKRGGLSGHAEFQGKTLFLKFNTGPSGHGTPAAAGMALALKRAGVSDVKVFLLEGEGGLTPGATHETLNSAWGMELNNLHFIIDWNDFGIDSRPFSDIVYGTPEDWFTSHGWDIVNGGSGEDFQSLSAGFNNLVNNNRVPSALYFKSRKGRGYLKYDNDSHGSPHPKNSELFWQTKKDYQIKYETSFINYMGAAPSDKDAEKKEFSDNLNVVAEVIRKDKDFILYIANRLVEIAESVPDNSSRSIIKDINPFNDPIIYDVKSYPKGLFKEPGQKDANRSALKSWGAWINAYGKKNYGRPLFIASSADLSGSTNISGFSEDFGEDKGFGWSGKSGSEDGSLLPQGITEFANCGIMTGLSSVNFSNKPLEEFNGFWGITSTYGSFSYLMYGMLRLYSQMSQDSDYILGKVIYVAGHSGPETADDSRTHFGIYSPGVTQLFPKGTVINLHPWEYNEVPVLLSAALKQKESIIALHLTRPPVEIPDREALGMDSHFEAAKGAYIIRDYREGQEKLGTFYVQGTSAVANIVKLLPTIKERDLNIKLVCITSYELFEKQSMEYKERIISKGDRSNSTVITTQAKSLMGPWLLNSLSLNYAISADWDDQWRTGGTLDEILDEAHLTPEHLLNGIESFIESKEKRISILKMDLE